MKFPSFCVFGVIVVLNLAGNIQSLFFLTSGSIKPTQRNQEERRSCNSVVHVMMAHGATAGPWGHHKSQEMCWQYSKQDRAKALQVAGSPHPCIAFRTTWKPCWPQGNSEKEWMLWNVSQTLGRAAKVGWKLLRQDSRHWLLPAQQFLAELHKTCLQVSSQEPQGVLSFSAPSLSPFPNLPLTMGIGVFYATLGTKMWSEQLNNSNIQKWGKYVRLGPSFWVFLTILGISLVFIIKVQIHICKWLFGHWNVLYIWI